MKAVRIIGIVLVLWGVGIQVHSVVDSWQDRNRAAAVISGGGEHAGHDMSQMQGMTMPAETPEPMWRLLLRGTLLAIAAGLALVPVAQGKSWGVWALLGVWLIIAVPRIAGDPRCWVAWDPTKHGCHLFMRSVVLAAVGLVLCAIGSRKSRPAATTA